MLLTRVKVFLTNNIWWHHLFVQLTCFILMLFYSTVTTMITTIFFVFITSTCFRKVTWRWGTSDNLFKHHTIKLDGNKVALLWNFRNRWNSQGWGEVETIFMRNHIILNFNRICWNIIWVLVYTIYNFSFEIWFRTWLWNRKRYLTFLFYHQIWVSKEIFLI